MSFGTFLAEKRKDKNLTQKQLSELLFLSESTISKWENDVSRPDISMVAELSKILEVDEHELITSSVDNAARLNARQARAWRRLTTAWDLFFYIGYAITLLTCFTVNIAVSHTLSWFWIVLSALILSASFTTFPKFITKGRLFFVPLIEFAALTVLLAVCAVYTGGSWFSLAFFPCLFAFAAVFLPIFLCKSGIKGLCRHSALLSVTADGVLLIITLKIIEYSVGGAWFMPLALPLTAIGFAVALVTVLICRYLRVNRLIKAGLNMFLWFSASLTIGYTLTDMLKNAGISTESGGQFNPLGFNLLCWSGDYVNCNVTFIVLSAFVLLGLVFTALGIFKKKQ